MDENEPITLYDLDPMRIDIEDGAPMYVQRGKAVMDLEKNFSLTYNVMISHDELHPDYPSESYELWNPFRRDTYK